MRAYEGECSDHSFSYYFEYFHSFEIELLQMVQQMTDSKFSGYGLPYCETRLANQDNQPTLPATAKKTPLRDLQNEVRITGPKSMEKSLFHTESGPIIEDSKACGTKRPAPEYLVSPLHLQSPTNAANGHLVYVRRRPDMELAKSSTSDNTSNITDVPQGDRKLGGHDVITEIINVPQGERKLGGHDEITETKSHRKEPEVCVPEVAPITRASLMSFSSGKPSVSPLPNSNHHPISPAIPPLEYPKKMHSRHWEERYCQLQDLLKVLDQSNQEDYMQMLRSLSSVELSRRAIELEKRSIQLSLEEAKEIQRVRLFDVLGKYPKISRSPFAQQGQLEY
ncbi:uncharacterized protein LOC131325540 [Rhododendron vialii]|uniref:uncharacterized protein LOC131325540 n=1 Tax=Rhododendron vialii TaxID=182163 RepID=UPI00265FE57C|nr:uncharacterized protein LOC131325540 [Rhododendron vialii]